MERTIVGLDLGSSKIKAAAAKLTPDGYMSLLGLEEAPASGISKGNIIDLAEASGAVESLMAKVKEKYGSKIFKVVVSIGGVGFSSDRSRASIVLQDSPRELTRHDVEKVVQIARNMNLSLNNFILHEIVEDYILDGQGGVKNPAGLFAKRLEVKLYTLFYNTSHIQNVIRCINYAGYDVERMTFSGLVSINSIASEDELKNGVIFLDLGHETTKIVMAAEGRIKFCGLINIGGADINRCISTKFKIPIASAEKLKLDSNVANSSADDEKINITVGSRGKEIPRSSINSVVKKKTDQFLNIIKSRLDNSSFMDSINSGIVMTGGGALLNGLQESMEEFFNLPARIGVAQMTSLKTEQPSHLFTPSIGAIEHYTKEMRDKNKKFSSTNPISSLTRKISTFINDYF